MSKIIIMQGLPASGKSTWAKEYSSANKDWIRVNRDDLRNMRGEYWIPKQEKLITAWEDSCIDIALDNGYNVILDATNLNDDRNKSRLDKLKAKFPELKSEVKFFDVSLKDCIKRDLRRHDSVGQEVIKGMYDKYLAPKAVKYKEDPRLPGCIIVDVDGTLADKGRRNPFAWDKVSEDIPKKETISMVNSYAEHNDVSLIIFTGRDGCCYEDTRQWLIDNGVKYDAIFIRPEGNCEKDSVIKKRIFEENIRGKYYVDFVVDDRDQVVEMWRKELGLQCYQVDYGDF